MAKRGDLAIVHTVSRVWVNGGDNYDSHAYALHVVTSITRDGAVKALRDLHRPESTPLPVARMARHTMVTVPAAVCDLAALAQHVATVRTRTADAGYSYIPNHDSPVEVLRDLAPYVSDPSAIDAVRAAAHRAVRESLDFVRADCARCGVRIGDGAGTVATDGDGCPIAVCRECPHGVNFTTAYPVGLEVTVTRGYAQYLTTRIERVIDYVTDGYYAGRSYVVTLAGYGARTLTEECFAPVDAPADRYAVTRETSQPETSQPVADSVPADGGAAAPVADGASSQPATVEAPAGVADIGQAAESAPRGATVETSHTVPADGGDLAQPATVAQPETSRETSPTVEAPADGGEVDMTALAATLAEMGFSLAPDGTVTDTAAPLAGAGLKDVCKQLAKRGGDNRGPLTHGDHAELLTALGDRQGADMMRVAGWLGDTQGKPLPDKARARLRAKVRAGVRGAEIPAVTDESLSRVTVAQPVPAQPVEAPAAQPAAPRTVTCPAPACGRKVRVTRNGSYGSHKCAGSDCVMSGQSLDTPPPAPRAAFSRPVAPAQPAAAQPVAPAPATVADSGQAAQPVAETTAAPETSRAAAPVEAPAVVTGPTVTVGGVEVPRAVSNDGNALEAPAPVPVPDRIGPGVWVVTGGGEITPVARSGRYAGADGHWVETTGLPRFAPDHTVRMAVIGDTVCPRPRFDCYCGLVHATPDILAALPIAPADGAAQPVETSQPVETGAGETSQPATVPADGASSQPVETTAGAAAPTVPAALAPVTRDEPHLYRADPRSRKDSRKRYRCQCGATYDARRIHLTPRELAEYRAQREREQTTAAPEVAPGVLRLEHTTDGGTVLYGTHKGDGTARVMGRAGLGWGFSRRIGPDGAWYVSGSRGKSADWRTRDRIDKAARALHAAGYRLAVLVHGEVREVDGVPVVTVEVPAGAAAPPVAAEVTAAQPVETSQPETAPETSRELAQPAADGGEVDAQPVPAGAAAPETAPREVCEAVWHPRAGTVRVFRLERTSRVEIADYLADTRAAAVAALAAHGYTVSGVWMADPFGSLSVSVDRAPAPAPESSQPETTGAAVETSQPVAPVAQPVATVDEPGVTYEAVWTPADGTVTVVRNVHAGVCGPFGESPADSREAAAAALAADGYAVTGDWVVSRLGEHCAPIVRMARPVVDFPHPAPYWAPGYGPADSGETSQPETTAQPETAPETSRELAPVAPVEAPTAQPETAQPVEWLTPAQTAQLVRAALRDAFPAVVFSVRCSRGSAVRVHWQDGPTEREVRAVTDAYRGADFDSLQELKTYRDAVILPDGRRVRFGAHFIFTSREETAQPVETDAQPVAPAPVAAAPVETSQRCAGCGEVIGAEYARCLDCERLPGWHTGRELAQPETTAAPETAQPVAVAPAPVAPSRDHHAAILRELNGRPLAGRVKVTRRDGAWSYRAPLADGGEVTGRAVWSEESAAWVVCEVVPTVPAPAAPVAAAPAQPVAPAVRELAQPETSRPVPAPVAQPVRPVMPARVAAALARVTAQPVAPRVAQPVAVPAAPVAPVAVAVPAGDRGRYAYAPGTRVRATLREVRQAIAAAARAPETAPLFAGVVCTVEADRPTVARPTGYVVVTVEASAGADLAAVWAAVDGIAVPLVPAPEVAAV